MAAFSFRDELSPNSLPGTPLQNTTLPAGGSDLFSPVTLVGGDGRIGAFEIYFVPSVGGILSVSRTTPNEVSTTEKLNNGSEIAAGTKFSDVITGTVDDIISLQFSATGGTCYLTVADVSGDLVKWIKA
ncbi:MAG: hypothetical protein JXA44_08315 [Methanospirillaceae archaeon]|nr:hypothetical protein [Methanospirillaceae archaeon]